MKKIVLLVGVLAFLLSGCFFKREVESFEAGVVLSDGVSISEIVDAGRYTDMNWYADLKIISVSAITVEWNDPSLVTKDKQPISLTLQLTFNRSRVEDDIEKLFTSYQREALDDTALSVLVLSRVPSVAKAITTQYTLDEMLGISEGTNNRLVVEAKLQELLAAELAEIGVVLQNASLADIGVDQAFLDALSAKAQASINIEVARAKTSQLEQQLLQEEAQTQIALEIANRQNEVNELLAQAFADNPEYFELERLRLLADLLDENDLVIYVPEGSDIATVLGASGVIPVEE